MLVEEGMLCDGRFADAFTRARIDRGAGPIRVRAELIARGVAAELIDKALEQYQDWWNDLALEVYQKRYQKEEAPLEYEQLAKRANFLKNRGFTADQIRYVLTQNSMRQ